MRTLREGDVVRDGEVREERGLLRSVGDAAVARRRVGEVCCVAAFVLTDEVGVRVGKQAGEARRMELLPLPEGPKMTVQLRVRSRSMSSASAPSVVRSWRR